MQKMACAAYDSFEHFLSVRSNKFTCATRQNYDEAKAFTLTPAKKARRIEQLLAQAARLGLQLAPATEDVNGKDCPFKDDPFTPNKAEALTRTFHHL